MKDTFRHADVFLLDLLIFPAENRCGCDELSDFGRNRSGAKINFPTDRVLGVNAPSYAAAATGLPGTETDNRCRSRAVAEGANVVTLTPAMALCGVETSACGAPAAARGEREVGTVLLPRRMALVDGTGWPLCSGERNAQRKTRGKKHESRRFERETWGRGIKGIL